MPLEVTRLTKNLAAKSGSAPEKLYLIIQDSGNMPIKWNGFLYIAALHLLVKLQPYFNEPDSDIACDKDIDGEQSGMILENRSSEKAAD
jgi:hypothetical protein